MTQSRAALWRTFVFPPLGIFDIWTGRARIWVKILGTLGVLLLSIMYASLVIFLLVQFTGLQIEWRGGYAPAFTYHKTGPDYAALDRDRATRTRFFEGTNVPGGGACWPGFRGENGEGHYGGRFL